MEEEVVKGLVVSSGASGSVSSGAGVVEEEAKRILEREEERMVRAKEMRKKERAREAECPIDQRL